MRWSQEPGLAVLQTASSVAVVLLQEDALLTAGSKTLGLRVKETLELGKLLVLTVIIITW